MDALFWQKKWEQNQIGFHEPQPHSFLVRHFASFGLTEGACVFVPLCGKSLDIHWLLEQGFAVVGVELSRIAVESLFQDLGYAPCITERNEALLFEAGNLKVYVGNIFNLTEKALGNISAVYDRAALIALPEAMRHAYADHVISITQNAPQLLITLGYEQALRKGPPFSVDAEEVRQLYGAFYTFEVLERDVLEGGLKGVCPAEELVWHLTPLSK
ncbi:thiopurine S-methyltransferase [Acetobacter tropicalis]|uniref:Thiopurine S-methyltransferase n=1 Tax=Acetobacter tropicalis TaxID=104102 RepID=A0A149TR68_9PROT|nr:thiopurine S-methyltransferase [Acetobacter tropicalis]KXV55648.1 thiopurine S-methyltransferase [Acetobacter tropicalis]